MAEQLLHLVFGGEVNDTQGGEFSDLDKLDIVGIYPNTRLHLRHGKVKARQTWTMRL